MFSRARWSLTLWFAGALAIILGITGAAIYLTAHISLFNQVNNNLRLRSTQEERLLVARLVDRRLRDQLPVDIVIGPTLTAGGYFYALATQEAVILAKTPNVDPQGLAPPVILKRPWTKGGPLWIPGPRRGITYGYMSNRSSPFETGSSFCRWGAVQSPKGRPCAACCTF